MGKRGTKSDIAYLLLQNVFDRLICVLMGVLANLAGGQGVEAAGKSAAEGG